MGANLANSIATYIGSEKKCITKYRPKNNGRKNPMHIWQAYELYACPAMTRDL